ncbi:uncharacterized protein F4822DRAFT_388309 [Hypoxylon trugodes]|uniref:uncharacterized protein n=1 Tax=Hypoxylon trugodes TaxID=326681 RepID=UPI00218E58B5|nr:uncharacterized protein F4822DRAFT_388309 [Hypoxylon trugodes]KAI1394477.1 hypothetical protein F4822DRAFT_388309 [Hypoxylon trugodes]
MDSTSVNIPAEAVAALPPDLQAQIPLYYESLQPNLYASAIICIVIAYVAVILRIYARRLKAQALGMDDFMIIAGLFFTSVFVALCILVTVFGEGRHRVVTVLEHPDHVVPFTKATIAAGVIYNPALFCTKISILLLYYRVFPSRRFKWVCIGVGIFVAAYSITAIMTNIFQCVPVKSNWDPTVTPHCINLGSELIVVSSLNVLTDASILCLPMPIIWRLKTDFRRKLQLTGLFLLGSFVVVVSIIRVTYVSNVSFSDGFWANSYPSMWSVVENCIAVVAACLPVMRPVFNKVLYGTPDPEKPSQDEVDLDPRNNRHIITIGGSDLQMKGFSGGHASRGTNVTAITSITHGDRNSGGSFTQLMDN